MLDEVVVVGYGSMKRSDLTGSVSSVSAKNVEGFKTGSVMEALGGQVAGVQITQTDGTPGSGFDIKVRGIGTMTGDASPLYIERCFLSCHLWSTCSQWCCNGNYKIR